MIAGKSLGYLSEALPIEGRALLLRASFNRSLVESLSYILEACVEVIPPDLFRRASQKLDSLNPGLKLSGLLGIIHRDLFDAAEQNDVTAVNQIVERFVQDDFQIEELKYINISTLNNYYAPLAQHLFSQELTREIKFAPLSSEEYEKAKKVIEQAAKLLKGTFPDFSKEFDELVSEIMILHAQGLKQGSNADVFGMIYKSTLFRVDKLTDGLDFLIHEQSHLYVHLLNKDDPLILNPNDLYESPLREEKRPLMGIYHAAFVLARTQYVLKKALSLNEIPKKEQTYCQELIDYYKKRFAVGFEILNAHAQMTPLAKELIYSASKLVA